MSHKHKCAHCGGEIDCFEDNYLWIGEGEYTTYLCTKHEVNHYKPETDSRKTVWEAICGVPKRTQQEVIT